MPQPPITEICLKITYLKVHWNFPGANELMLSFVSLQCYIQKGEYYEVYKWLEKANQVPNVSPDVSATLTAPDCFEGICFEWLSTSSSSSCSFRTWRISCWQLLWWPHVKSLQLIWWLGTSRLDLQWFLNGLSKMIGYHSSSLSIGCQATYLTAPSLISLTVCSFFEILSCRGKYYMYTRLIPGQYPACWWPDSRCCQVISRCKFDSEMAVFLSWLIINQSNRKCFTVEDS